ncbi:MAG: ADOP family duplicated permease [Vicinamibacterales bacterium]
MRPPLVTRVLLAIAAAIVPGDLRGDWRREWDAEIAWRLSQRHGRSGLVGRSAGAVSHALWLRGQRWRPEMWTYDLRIVVRSLLRRPSFLTLAVVTLAIGIGATAAVFGAVRAVMLRPLPFPSPDRLVSLTTTGPDGPPTGFASSPPDVVDWAEAQQTLVALAAFTADGLTIGGSRTPAEQVAGAMVTGEFFTVLGIEAVRGRLLTSADTTATATPVVVIADTLWRRRFGGDPAILGATVVVDGIPRAVVGVLAPGVTYPLGAEAWVPLSFSPEELLTQRGAQYLDVIGRLRPGITAVVAEADLDAIAARLAATYPRTNEGRGVLVRDLRTAIVGETRSGLLLLLAAAVLVLLVVCANVAGLLVTRALAASRDLAIRTALGATRGRLVRAAVVEGGVLAAAGALAGLGLAWAASRRIAALDDALRIPLLDGTHVDGVVLAVTIAAAAFSALAVAVLPAWRSAASGALAARAGGGSPRRGRIRSLLVVGEIGLALVLVVGAVTLVRSFVRLMTVDVGFATSDRIQTFALTLPETRYTTPASRSQFVERLLAGVRSLPGVERAGAVFGLPLTGFGYVISLVERDGVRVAPDAPDVLLAVRVVTPDYLQTIGLAVRRGRPIDQTDGWASPPVVLVNEAAARLVWPDADALGRDLRLGTRLGRDDQRFGGRVVGVVADTRERGPMAPPRPTVYAAHAQFPASFVAVAVRTAGPAASPAALRAELAAVDPEVPMFRVRTMAQLAASTVAQPRLLALLMTAFGAAALAVAAIGLYGVLSLAVEARRREIGIRRAIGATVGDVVGLVARDTGRLLAAGLACGVVGAAAAQTLLSGLSPDAAVADGGVYATAIAVFTAVAALAAWVPCRRALAVDPAATLKAE